MVFLVVYPIKESTLNIIMISKIKGKRKREKADSHLFCLIVKSTSGKTLFFHKERKPKPFILSR